MQSKLHTAMVERGNPWMGYDMPNAVITGSSAASSSFSEMLFSGNGRNITHVIPVRLSKRLCREDPSLVAQDE